MTFLPIVERELRTACRRRGSYWMRVGAALVALLLGAWMLLWTHFGSQRQLGLSMFVALSVIAFLYALLSGLRPTADCLSEEKREGTLGLLFLTDLKGYDIVLGKLAATSLNVFYGLLAILPIMAVPLLMGGVTWTEFWRVALVAVNSLFFSLAIGLFTSSVSRSERAGIVLALLILLTFTAGLPLIGALRKDWSTASHVDALFLIPSPGYTCFMAFEGTQASLRSYNFFWPSLLCVHLLGWVCLVLACFIVPRAWQDSGLGTAKLGLRQRWQRWAQGSPEWRRRFRTRLLEEDPFYWLAARDRTKPWVVWSFLAVCAMLWLWGRSCFKGEWLNQGTYILTGITLNSVLKVWLVSEACRHFVADRKSGALELLLSTPLTVREILRGQFSALLRQFAAPAGLVLFIEFIFLGTHRDDPSWILVCAAGMIMFAADMITLSWVGMWTGLTSRHANRASAMAVSWILILPWVGFAVLMTFLTLTDMPGNRFLNDKAVTLIWLGIGLVNDLVFAQWARRRLLEDFRQVATQRFEAKVRGSRFKVQGSKLKV
jgi:ABC-type transport system involved in cytochrome c biogenesis permease component